MKRLLWILIPLMLTSCIKDLEQEGVYTESSVIGRVVERTSQQPVGGLTVQLVSGNATLNTTTTSNDGTFSLPITAEQQSNGCQVVVSADSLYIGCTADVPAGSFGRKEYDLGVLYVDGPGLPVVHTNSVPTDAVSATSVTLTGNVADDLRSPDSLASATRQLVQHKHHLLRACLCHQRRGYSLRRAADLYYP